MAIILVLLLLLDDSLDSGTIFHHLRGCGNCIGLKSSREPLRANFEADKKHVGLDKCGDDMERNLGRCSWVTHHVPDSDKLRTESHDSPCSTDDKSLLDELQEASIPILRLLRETKEDLVLIQV